MRFWTVFRFLYQNDQKNSENFLVKVHKWYQKLICNYNQTKFLHSCFLTNSLTEKVIICDCCLLPQSSVDFSLTFSIGKSAQTYLCTPSMPCRRRIVLRLVATCKWQKFASAYVYFCWSNYLFEAQFVEVHNLYYVLL